MSVCRNPGKHLCIDLGADHLHEKQIPGCLVGAELRHIEAGHFGDELFRLIYSLLNHAVIAFTMLQHVVELVQIDVYPHILTVRCDSQRRVGCTLKLFHFVGSDVYTGEEPSRALRISRSAALENSLKSIMLSPP